LFDGHRLDLETGLGLRVPKRPSMATTAHRRYASTHNTAMTPSTARIAAAASSAGKYPHAPAIRNAISVSRAEFTASSRRDRRFPAFAQMPSLPFSAALV
jgi:hypothetical protein